MMAALAAFVGEEEISEQPATPEPAALPATPAPHTPPPPRAAAHTQRVECVTPCRLRTTNANAIAMAVCGSHQRHTLELYDAHASALLGWMPWTDAPIVSLSADPGDDDDDGSAPPALLVATRGGGVYVVMVDALVGATGSMPLEELWVPRSDIAPFASVLWWRPRRRNAPRRPVIACRDGTVHLPTVAADGRRGRSISIAVSARCGCHHIRLFHDDRHCLRPHGRHD